MQRRGGGGPSPLQQAYRVNAGRPVAFLDETYYAEREYERFYVVSAVISPADQMDGLRKVVDDEVPSGRWHTRDELQTLQGRERVRDLLNQLDAEHEACIITHKVPLHDEDSDGEAGREAVLKATFHALWTREDPVGLAVLEARREQAQRRRDQVTRALAEQEGLVGAAFRMTQASPAEEHLLWLPDLICGAYRQAITRGDSSYLDMVSDLVTIIYL